MRKSLALPTQARMPRPLPATWKEPMHAPASLPATYRPLLSTIKPLALGTVFGAPALSKPVPRPANAHLLLAQRGDAVIRTVLLDIGADLGLTLSGRHHLVSVVGSNATLAQICLESGLLDAAIAASTRRVTVKGVCYKAAAGIFKAVAAALVDEFGATRAAEVLKLAMFPWVEAVVRQKIVPYVRANEGAKAAAAINEKVAREMVAMLAAYTGVVVGV